VSVTLIDDLETAATASNKTGVASGDRSDRTSVRPGRRGRRLPTPVVVAGDTGSVIATTRGLRQSAPGMRVVGVCADTVTPSLAVDGHRVAVLAPMSAAFLAARLAGAEILVLTGKALSEPDVHLAARAGADAGHGPRVMLLPEAPQLPAERLRIRSLGAMSVVEVTPLALRGPVAVAKEILDRAIAALLLVVLAPLLLIVALLVRLTSRGPAFYRQTRVGRDGRLFRIWKFRSMIVGADEMVTELDLRNEADGPLFKVRRDPRCTRLGRWLRRTSIDELPQLLNVVAGHMSIVGPRPPIPQEVAQYSAEERRRLLVKPGLTGLWQVKGRNDTDYRRRVVLDTYYVRNQNLLLDLYILLKTTQVVLGGSGAY